MSASISRVSRRWLTSRPAHMRTMATKSPGSPRPAPTSSSYSTQPPNSKILAFARYSPWSKSFPGTWRTRALLQVNPKLRYNVKYSTKHNISRPSTLSV
ncbi:hypothetical protein C8R42DRAFT_269735 [Lentinula raphanica]|nr:hypothetical protein C8R42DRAFT_269735 [Lentinula raphanica]